MTIGNPPPIPDHLKGFPWYGPHQAWMLEFYGYCGHFPAGAIAVRASLDGASLDGASLDGASLDGASLVGASLVRASLDGARGIATEEEERATWRAVCEAIAAEPQRLEMGSWHGEGWDPATPGACGTTHCLAGWAQALCKEPVLRRMDAAMVGGMLLPRHAHLFYADNETVMDLVRQEVPGV